MHYRSVKGKKIIRDNNIIKKTDSKDNIFNLNNNILSDKEFSTARARRNTLFDQRINNNSFKSRSRSNTLSAPLQPEYDKFSNILEKLPSPIPLF